MMSPSFAKPDSDEIITSAPQASDFLLGCMQEKNQTKREEHHLRGIRMIQPMSAGETRSLTSAQTLAYESFHLGDMRGGRGRRTGHASH